MIKESEHIHQKTLFDWAEKLSLFYPELRWLHAIPNGGKRHIAVAVKLKSEGVKAGVFDVFLPVAKCGYYGLYIEMKCRKNRLTPAQIEFKQFVEEQNYKTEVCYHSTDAINIITRYLQGRSK